MGKCTASGLVAMVMLNALILIRVTIAADPPPVTAGTVIQLLFDKSSSKIKARGLLQRTSLHDLLPSTKKNLQLAFVVDGTDSMGADIKGVLESLTGMVSILHRQKGGAGNVSFTLVVYRDTKAAPGPVEFPLGKGFTGDIGQLHEAVAKVRTETGEPWFNELVDLGLHEAIQTLQWGDSKVTTRWVVLFGDAPPHREGFSDGDTQRYYSTKSLIESAKANQISVSCILCSSGFIGKDENEKKQLESSYVTLLPDLQDFMKQLSMQTGGVMWDLSSSDLREKLVEAANKQRENRQKIAHISPTELRQAQSLASQKQSNEAIGNRVRLAVLPHMPIAKMTFSSTDPAVIVAAEMREKFGLIPRVEIANPANVASSLVELRSSVAAAEGEQTLFQKLAKGLQVDYVIWGSYDESGDVIKLQSATYKRLDGSRLAQVGDSTPKGNQLGQKSLVFTVAEKLALNTAQELKSIDPSAAKTLEQVESNRGLNEAFNTPVSENFRASRELLAGLDSLELSLGLPKGNESSIELLNTAILKLKSAATIDAGNPYIYSLLANAYFNRAQWDIADDNVQEYRKALVKAYQNRHKSTHADIKAEIEADYALIVEQKAENAISLYESLLASGTESRINSALRAHWMLAGIYCGDWGVPSKVINPDKARQHIISIWANYSQSAEAEFYRTALQWDEMKGTQHPYYPKEHSDAVQELSKSVQ